jgi:hypothetical protein
MICQPFATLVAVSAIGGLLTTVPGIAENVGCIAPRPLYVEGEFEVEYTAGCQGHDEPEIMPLSDLAGSARDLTWTVVLPSSETSLVSAVAEAFWFGGPVIDSKAPYGQAFVELQFYPDARATGCSPGGDFRTIYARNIYTVCSPVWKLNGKAKKPRDVVTFNAMLVDGATSGEPLILRGGDTVTIHWYTTAQADGWHVTVADVTNGHEGTIVLNSAQDGPLMPVYDTLSLGKSLVWRGVEEAPASFAWEIGHLPDHRECSPGGHGCPSYNAQSWATTLPIEIKDVTFGDGSHAEHWAVVSGVGGKAEVAKRCRVYGGGYCVYPWYSLGRNGFRFGGVDFPGTLDDFGQAGQFEETPKCVGPLGFPVYCATIVQ